MEKYCKKCKKIVELGSAVDESGKYTRGLNYCLECGNEVKW